MKNSDIIHKPVISERSFADATRGVYTFTVSTAATKTDIRRAIEALFSVHVTEISTNNTKKTKSVASKTTRREKKFTIKKARVKLADGEKINLFEEEGGTA